MANASYLSAIQNDLAEQELLSEDKITDDEIILGESLNLKYEDKFIPRNKLHRVLAAHENTFRTIFFKHHNPDFASDYINSAKNILKKQNLNLERNVMIDLILSLIHI